MKIEIDKLKQHPWNHRIYGEEDNTDLLEKIKESGYIKPILITPTKTIISGHRRVDCCKKLGITEIDCEQITGDLTHLLEIMLSENAYRVKTNSQLLREGEIYRDLEKRKANQRQIETGKQNLSQSPVKFTRTCLEEKGRTTEIVAKKIGMSESSYKRGLKVMKYIETVKDPELKGHLIKALDENIDITSKVIEKPYATIIEIKDRTFVNLKNIGKVVREVEQEELKQKSHLPPGKYQVLYCDFTTHSPENLSKLPISEIGETDSVLFLWTTPIKLSLALELIKTWKFHYKTCMVWYKDAFEVSDKVEILLVSVKGNPPMIQQTSETGGKTEKPVLIRDMISKVYTGTKVELNFGDSNFEGWNLWK